MRSLFSFCASKEMSFTGAGANHRPELLRRKTLATSAQLAIIAAGLAMPFAVYGMVGGVVLPFIIASIALVGAMLSLALHQRQLFDEAATSQVFTLVTLGLVLSLASNQIGVAGVAIAALGPLLATLTSKRSVRLQSWVLLGGVVAIAAVIAIVGVSPIAVAENVLISTSAVTFLVSVVLVGLAAARIGAAHDAYDRSQLAAYRHLIEHVQDALMRFSSQGQVLMASRSSEQLFGCRRFELSNSTLAERLHVLDRPAYLTAFAAVSQVGTSRILEVRMRQDDPTGATKLPQFIWVEISMSAVVESDDRDARHEVIALFRNVTDRKDNEAQMAEARRAAEAASDAKSRFLATIGHELRTPLNAVVGFSEMMTSDIGGQLSPTHREYAGLIHQSGKHLLEVVRMLLDMSRIEAGKFELQAEPFLVDALVEPCFSMVEAMARERSVQLHVEIAKGLPMLVADERACRQILLNLMSNAIKFSHPNGSVLVSVKRQGQNLNISVSDRGIGMAPESLERIGEPFFQAQDGLTRGYEGTGLGLSIVKGLVDLHNGTLRAMSEIGAGTTVTVLLPINGPAINNEETATVTHLVREPARAPKISWQDEKRKAL